MKITVDTNVLARAVLQDDVALTIRDLLNAGNVVMNRPVVEAGLLMLEAGGDFTDGVIAYKGE